MAVTQTHRVHCIQEFGADKVKVADTSDKIDKCSKLLEYKFLLLQQIQQVNRIQSKILPKLSYIWCG